MPTPLSFRIRLRKLLFDTFNRDEFTLLLKDELNEIYDDIITKGKRELEFDEVIESLDRRDKLPDLFRATLKSRPDNQALAGLKPIVEIVTAHSKAVDETKGQSDSEAAPSIAALPPATGLQASVVAASFGEQTISLSLARTKQDEVSRRICVIEVPGQSIGTGFLIGPRQILTNRHVLDEALRRNANNIRAVFDHSGDQSYESLPRKNILLKAPFTMDEVDGLDYAVLPLDADVEADRGFFTACPQRLGDKSSVTIMGHPAQGTTALGLQYSWGMIRDINDESKRISYTAQTSPGSSGSPIFNANFELVGLHYHGQAGVNNHGIPIWAIVKSLKDKGHPELLSVKSPIQKSKDLSTGHESIGPDSPVVTTPPGDDPAFPTPVTPDARIATELGQELFLAKTARDLQKELLRRRDHPTIVERFQRIVSRSIAWWGLGFAAVLVLGLGYLNYKPVLEPFRGKPIRIENLAVLGELDRTQSTQELRDLLTKIGKASDAGEYGFYHLSIPLPHDLDNPTVEVRSFDSSGQPIEDRDAIVEIHWLPPDRGHERSGQAGPEKRLTDGVVTDRYNGRVPAGTIIVMFYHRKENKYGEPTFQIQVK